VTVSARRAKDRDFVETVEGFFFCLVGYLHPPDRYTAYLKYTPAPIGRWARADMFYHRELPYYHVRNVMVTLEALARDHPRYVWHDPVRDLRFSFVPREAVRTYYQPEARLADLCRQPQDALEEDVAALGQLLSSASGVAPEHFGITGSILLRLHNPAFSDIDLLVYGRQNALCVKQAVAVLRGSHLADLDGERRARWHAETTQRFALGPEALRHLEARRWNHFFFRDRYVSVHPTRSDAEIGETYGAHRYRAAGVLTIEATLADTREAMFLPAAYGLTEVVTRTGEASPIAELVSHEGLFGDFGDPGDRIVARGAVEVRDGVPHRLVLGAAAVPDGGSLTLLRYAKEPERG